METAVVGGRMCAGAIISPAHNLNSPGKTFVRVVRVVRMAHPAQPNDGKNGGGDRQRAEVQSLPLSTHRLG